MKEKANPQERRFLVATINHSHAGFFSYVTFALNHIIYARSNAMEPVVQFAEWSQDGPNAFFDAAQGPNMWDYYFEPVGQFTYQQLECRLADEKDQLTREHVIRLTKDQLRLLHAHDLDSVYTYPYGIQVPLFERQSDWYEQQRAKARPLVRDHIRVKAHIADIVSSFVADNFQGHPVLGIHMRGTDKGAAHSLPGLMRVIPPSEYFPYIDKYIAENEACRIFVATDQKQFLNEVAARYGDRVISYDSIRASGWRNPFEKPAGMGYKLGEDVLVDALLLSRCDFLLKCTSAVGEYAMYFNDQLKCTDLNMQDHQLSGVDQFAIAQKRKFYGRYLKLKQWARLMSGNKSALAAKPANFHDLQTMSGFGDRLLDLWAAVSVSLLKHPDRDLAVRWSKGHKFQAFVGEYSTDLFSVGGCRFVRMVPFGGKSIAKKFSHTALNDFGTRRLPRDREQIVLRHGMNFGNNCPDRIYEDLAFYGLGEQFSHSDVLDRYGLVARSTTPSFKIVAGIPHDIRDRVGVHIRLTDKLVSSEEEFSMSRETWHRIEAGVLRYLHQCVADGTPVFVCSDDREYMHSIVEDLRARGGDVAVSAPVAKYAGPAGYEALVDFFALSRCRQIVQMTKYSTFSMAAAMIGNVPLMNFFGSHNETGSRVDIWRSAIPQFIEYTDPRSISGTGTERAAGTLNTVD